MVSKYLVIVLNVLMLLIGTVVLTLGLWGMNVGSQVSHIVSLTTPTLIMLLGVTTILVSLFGIYAAAEEDPLLLQLYLGLMTLILVGQVVLSSMALARQADVDLMAYDAWDQAYKDDRGILSKFEKTYSCCGFASLYDRAVPNNCTDDPEFGFAFPCREKISEPLKSGLKTIGSMGMILAVLEFTALLLAFVLYSDFYSGYNERDAARQAETRHLLRDGAIPAHQYSHTTHP